MLPRSLILLLTLLATAFAAPVQCAPKSVSKAMRQFVDEMVRVHKFKRTALTKLLQQAQVQDSIIEAMNRPAEGKPWYEYREIFITPARVNGGREFWQQHADELQRAEQEYGVPAQIIIAIIGVETRYGDNQGNYRVLDALTTLAFHYPKRAQFFRRELQEFLLLARQEKLDPLTVKGSYAGAMGVPQFMPSSYRRYAVDFDKDGKRDLLTSTSDVIGSVANYFNKHNWSKGAPIITRAQAEADKHKKLIDKGPKPSTTLSALSKQGVLVNDPNLPPTTLGALIQLEDSNGPEHWVGLQNFYVITRYNHSPLYAMAVYQLSQQILAQREESVVTN